MSDTENVQYEPGAKRADRKKQDNTYSERSKIIAGLATVLALLLFVGIAFAASRQSNKGSDTAASSATTTTAGPLVKVANIPKGLPPGTPPEQPGPNPFNAKGVSSMSQWLYLADTEAGKGNWGYWLSAMGVQHWTYKQARSVLDWHVAQEKTGRSFVTVVGSNGLVVINTRPKTGSYEPFRAYLVPGDKYLAIAPDCPSLSRPPIPGDGFRTGCANAIAGTRYCLKGGKHVPEELPCPPKPEKPKEKAPCTPTWKSKGSPIYQDPDSHPTPGASVASHNETIAKRGLGAEASGKQSTGKSSEDNGSSGDKQSPPPTGVVKPVLVPNPIVSTLPAKPSN